MTSTNFKSTLVLLLAALGVFLTAPSAYAQVATPDKQAAADTNVPVTTARLKRADFKQETPSHDARAIADWVIDSGDSGRVPFVIVDKLAARVFVFDAAGHLQGSAPALLGIARGDHSVSGVGERELSAIRVQDRTTPAGRFEAHLGRNYKNKEILWVDYDAAISMHPVIDVPKERRPQRLASPTVQDNRISFGCINVPIQFFENVVSRAFTGTSGIVYVMPDVRTLRSVFTAYAAEHPADKRTEVLAAPQKKPARKVRERSQL